MMDNENKEKSCGALWIKAKGEKRWFSMSIEIDGEKYSFVAFPNDYKKEDKHPDFRIFKARGKREEPKPEEITDIEPF